MTTDITPANRALAESILAEFAPDTAGTPKRGRMDRLDAFWQSHPRASAMASFALAAVFAAVVVWAYIAHDLMTVGLGYVAMVASGIWGALEWHRASVSAGQQVTR